jgi:TolB-like protein/Tfp pilus assembly protein PilF
LAPRERCSTVVILSSLALLLAVMPSGRLAVFQCPDGAPPPCRTADARPRSTPAAMSVAVLDFQNLSRDTADAFLGDGLAEELTGRLGQVGRLTVTSRAVVRRLPNAATMPIPQIGRTLNVSYLVNGSVRRAGTRLRVNVELLRASSGVQEWSSQYDRSESDLLTLQEEVATAVAQGIAGRLLPAERTRLTSRPTQNAEAYELFLRGRALRWTPAGEAPLARAVALDTGFAAAWAELSVLQSNTYWNYADRTEARLERARAAAERALRLAPDLAAARMAMGYYHYWGRRDYAAALTEFGAAVALQPNNADVHAAMANVLRRQGRWEPSLASRMRGIALAPNDAPELQEVVFTLLLLRRFSAADSFALRAIAADPAAGSSHLYRFMVSLARGDSGAMLPGDAARRTQGAAAEALLNATWMLQTVRLDTAMQTEVLRLPPASTDEDREAQLLLRAQVLSLRGNAAAAVASFDSLRILLEAVVLRRPDDDGFHALLAKAYAGMGRGPDAVREAREALHLLPPERDALTGMEHLQGLAEVLCQTSDTTGALDALEHVLAGPGVVTAPMLRRDPLWAPLRGNPRFEQLLAAPQRSW